MGREPYSIVRIYHNTHHGVHITMLTTIDRVGFPHRREWIAIACAALPFIINLTSVSYSTYNGMVQSFSYFDLADVLLGIAVAAMTFRNMIFINEGEAKYKTIRIALTVVLLAAAVYHVASGFGLLIYPQAYVATLR